MIRGTTQAGTARGTGAGGLGATILGTMVTATAMTAAGAGAGAIRITATAAIMATATKATEDGTEAMTAIGAPVIPRPEAERVTAQAQEELWPQEAAQAQAASDQDLMSEGREAASAGQGQVRLEAAQALPEQLSPELVRPQDRALPGQERQADRALQGQGLSTGQAVLAAEFRAPRGLPLTAEAAPERSDQARSTPTL